MLGHWRPIVAITKQTVFSPRSQKILFRTTIIISLNSQATGNSHIKGIIEKYSQTGIWEIGKYVPTCKYTTSKASTDDKPTLQRTELRENGQKCVKNAAYSKYIDPYLSSNLH